MAASFFVVPSFALAQSPLTDGPSDVKFLFGQDIPLPPKRPTGFAPVKPATPDISKPNVVTPDQPVAEPIANTPIFPVIPLPPVRPKELVNAPAEVPMTIAPAEKTPGTHANPKHDQVPELAPDDVIKAASANLSDMTQFQGSFTQIDGNGRKVTGHLAVARPGRLRFDYDPPSTVVVIADGNSVGVIDRKLKTRDIYAIFLTPLKFLLKSKIDLKKDITIIDVRSDPDAYVITAEDKSTFAGTSKIALGFDKHTLKIKQWTVTDPQGYDTTVILGPLDTTSEPDGDLFVIPEKIG